jgi:AFG3 family protein
VARRWGQIFNIGKSKAQLFDRDTMVKVNLNDVAGLEEAKVEIMEIVDFLKNPNQLHQFGREDSERSTYW